MIIYFPTQVFKKDNIFWTLVQNYIEGENINEDFEIFIDENGFKVLSLDHKCVMVKEKTIICKGCNVEYNVPSIRKTVEKNPRQICLFCIQKGIKTKLIKLIKGVSKHE